MDDILFVSYDNDANTAKLINLICHFDMLD